MWPWPLTLKFNRVRAVVTVHIHAKYHQPQCSGSWVIMLTNFFCHVSQWQRIRRSGPVTLTFDLRPWDDPGYRRADWLTSSSSMAGQLLLGNSWSIGTSHWRHPFQWPSSRIRQTRLNIRMNLLATVRNYTTTEQRGRHLHQRYNEIQIEILNAHIYCDSCERITHRFTA